jgi:hypothetical protein
MPAPDRFRQDFSEFGGVEPVRRTLIRGAFRLAALAIRWAVRVMYVTLNKKLYIGSCLLIASQVIYLNCA